MIGTLAARAVAEGMEAVIVSGDKDFLQLVGDRVHLLNPGRGGPQGVAAEWVDEERASAKLGVPPAQVVDYLALVGDSSDNVPGAPGIGPKTARKLLESHATVEEILDQAEEIRAKRPRESLIANRERVLLSKELVTIRTDVGVDAELEDLKVSVPDGERLRRLFVELEFRTLLGRLKGMVAGGASAGPEYVLVADADGVEAAARACREAGVMGVAVLNRTLVPTWGGVAGMAMAVGPGTCHYLPIAHESAMSLGLGGGEGGDDGNLPALDSEAMAPLRAVLADPRHHQGGARPQALPDRLPPRRAGAGRTPPRRHGGVLRAGPGPSQPRPGRPSHRPPGPGGDRARQGAGHGQEAARLRGRRRGGGAVVRLRAGRAAAPAVGALRGPAGVGGAWRSSSTSSRRR